MRPKLTTKIVRKAKENADLTHSGRIIAWSPEYDRYFDYPDTPELHKKFERNIVAMVSWDGTVEKM